MPPAPQIDIEYELGSQDSFSYNTVACSTATNRCGLHIHNVRGNAYVYRNTIYNRGTGGAVMINDDQITCPGHVDCCWGGTLEFKGNAMYSRSTGTGSNDFAMKIAIENYSFPSVVSDYNLFSHYGSNTGGRSVNWAPCGGTGANYTPAGFYSATTYLNGGGLDRHSVYGSPLFTDTTWANFNPRPTAGSRAIGTGPGGGEIGAYDFDVSRPDEVSDLIATGSSTKTVVLAWTDVGDDSLTGTAASYLLRTSASPITNATEWNNATPVTITITPQLAGTLRFFTVTGLSPQTAYYFALKTLDDFSNPSGISNNAYMITQPEGEGGHAEP